MKRKPEYNADLVVGSENQNKKMKIPTEKERKGVNLDQIIKVNGLDYMLPSNASAAIARQHSTHYFDKPSYSVSQGGGTIEGQCYWNTGAHYIDTANSFLAFNLIVKLTKAATTVDGFYGSAATNNADALSHLSFGTRENSSASATTFAKTRGSVMNLIREIRIHSRSGTELARERERHRLLYKTCPYHEGFGFTQSVASILHTRTQIGGGGELGIATTTLATIGGDGALDAEVVANIPVVIPICYLSGLFHGPGYTKLMPAQLAQGLKVSLEFEDPRNVFLGITNDGSLATGADWNNGGAVNMSLELADMRFSLDGVMLADSVLRVQNKIAATHGLEYYYPAQDLTRRQSSTNTLNMDSRKAVSRALAHYTQIVQSEDIKLPSVNTDYFASLPGNSVSEFQSHIGSHYYPNQKVTQPIENFAYSIIAHEQFNNPRRDSCQIQLSDFLTGRDAMFSQTFERSNIIPLSGVPMNNTRTLTLDFQFSATPAGGEYYEAFSFLHYIKLARVFLNNVVLRE